MTESSLRADLAHCVALRCGLVDMALAGQLNMLWVTVSGSLYIDHIT